MSEPTKKPDDAQMIVTMTVAELRRIVAEEVLTAIGNNTGDSGDRMLDVHEAAAFLHYSEDWLYRHWKKIPGARKIGAKGLRFSRRDLQRWANMRKPSAPLDKPSGVF